MNETKEQYEGAILTQLIKNSERLAIVEQNIVNNNTEIKEIKQLIKSSKTLLITIFIGIVINIISQFILKYIF